MTKGKRTVLAILGGVLVILVAAFATLPLRIGGAASAPPAGTNGVAAETPGDFSYFTPPKPVPPISFQNGNGRTLSLADFKGRVILVNFWATWCAPCVKEMPSLDRLQAELGGPDFTVIDVSLDRQGKDAVLPFFAANKLTHLAVYLDPRSVAFRAWQGQGVPTSFLIGRDGLARGVTVGSADWDSPASLAIVRHAIAEGKHDGPTKATVLPKQPPHFG